MAIKQSNTRSARYIIKSFPSENDALNLVKPAITKPENTTVKYVIIFVVNLNGFIKKTNVPSNKPMKYKIWYFSILLKFC